VTDISSPAAVSCCRLFELLVSYLELKMHDIVIGTNILLTFVCTAAFPLFGNQMYKKLNNHWASTLLAFPTVVMIPFPYLFFRYGKRIRANSRFATS
jgi:hypothetical protein